MKPSPSLSSGVSRDTISLDCCGDWATLRSRQPRQYVTEYMKRPTKDALPPALRNRLIRLAAFQNPEFYKLQAMRLPTYDKPRIIACAEDHPKHVGLPRGCLDEVRQTLSDLNIKAMVRDERNPGLPLKATFQGALSPEQTVAAHAI